LKGGPGGTPEKSKRGEIIAQKGGGRFRKYGGSEPEKRKNVSNPHEETSPKKKEGQIKGRRGSF